MPGTDAKAVASQCLHAWSTGDFETCRSFLDDDVTFVGPLGSTTGADDYIRGVQRLAQMVEGVEQKLVFGEGDDVCIIYDLITTQAGPVPTAGWYHLRDGKIASVRPYFDARPLA